MDKFPLFKGLSDYIPMMLITLYFIADSEMEKHALNTSCCISITIITAVIFYVMVLRFKNTKLLSLIVAIAVWIVLMYMKRKYVPK